eukprot:3939290-Rhodomonas_salina.2
MLYEGVLRVFLANFSNENQGAVQLLPTFAFLDFGASRLLYHATAFSPRLSELDTELVTVPALYAPGLVTPGRRTVNSGSESVSLRLSTGKHSVWQSSCQCQCPPAVSHDSSVCGFKPDSEPQAEPDRDPATMHYG